MILSSALIATSQSMLYLSLHPGHINLSIFAHGGDHAVWLLKKSLDTFHTFLMVLRSNLHRGIKLVHVLDIDFWIRTSPAN